MGRVARDGSDTELPVRESRRRDAERPRRMEEAPRASRTRREEEVEEVEFLRGRVMRSLRAAGGSASWPFRCAQACTAAGVTGMAHVSTFARVCT